jgi:hypothetical protein
LRWLRRAQCRSAVRMLSVIAESTLKGDDELAPQSGLLCGGGVYLPILEKMSRKGAPPQAEVTKSL